MPPKVKEYQFDLNTLIDKKVFKHEQSKPSAGLCSEEFKGLCKVFWVHISDMIMYVL